MVIVPQAIGNSLLIGGSPDGVDEIRKLIEQLDQPAALVLFEVVIAEAPPGEVKPASTKSLVRVRLIAANNNPASVTLGRIVPTITGVVVAPFAETSVVENRPMGTILSITPRVRPDGTVV